MKAALAIGQYQISLREKFDGCVVLKVNYEGDLFTDTNTQPLNTAWMVYDNIHPDQIEVCWH